MKKNQITRIIPFFFALLAVVYTSGCNPFKDDGITDSQYISSKGYFYITDQTSYSLIMLDYGLREIKRWSLKTIAPGSTVQGLAFDGNYVWLAFSDPNYSILRVDTGADELVVIKTISAPPNGRGTNRGIAWDGQNLWALNSGSKTYNYPPTLYKIQGDTIAASYVLPSGEPRALAYVEPKTDVYGRGMRKGFYYTDIEQKKIYYFSSERRYFDTAFSTPKPPLGQYNRYPVGLASDGEYFYLINSSDAADHLYRLNYTGKEESRFDLPYEHPGSIIWTMTDLRLGSPPAVYGIVQSRCALGSAKWVDIMGSGFKSSATVGVDFGAGISVDSVKYVNENRVQAYINISSSAAVGKRNIRVNQKGSLWANLTNAFEVTSSPVTDYLYVCDQNYYRIYKLRIEDSTIVNHWNVKSVSSNGSLQGIAYDGRDFWVSASYNDKSIYKISLPDNDTVAVRVPGSVVIPVKFALGTIRSLVYANNYLWLSVSGPAATSPGKIYRIDTTAAVVLDSITTTSQEPRGLLFQNGHFWCVDNSNKAITEYSYSSASWSTAVLLPLTVPTGLSYDGINLWLANTGTISNAALDYVQYMNLNGQLLNYIDIRRAIALYGKGTYDPSLTGILYLAK